MVKGRFLLVILIACTVSGCHGRYRPTTGCVAENEGIRVSISEICFRYGNLYVYPTITNKTDCELELHYGAMAVESAGRDYGGKLQAAPYVRVSKPFKLHPHVTKRCRPLFFDNVPFTHNLTFIIRYAKNLETDEKYPPLRMNLRIRE